MSKRESFLRYNLIIKKLIKVPATFAEVSNYLDKESKFQGYHFNISIRTFQRDLEDIRSIFNIDIKYNFFSKLYYVDGSGESDINNRMMEAFDLFNSLNLSQDLTPFIQLEKRRPQGTENLYGLLHAIKNKLLVKFVYQKFWEEEGSNRVAEPYAMKEFKNRWYVLAKDCHDGHVKSFALDRLSNLEITNSRFQTPATYNIEENYRYCFGIISPTGETPQEILLSFDPFQGKYIKTLPLHETQQIVVDNEDELQVKLKLFITHDLIMELLSFGDNMKVLKPKALIKEIKEAHQKAFEQY
jgi:predicted DNA-binding transcriptional regulator YafY